MRTLLTLSLYLTVSSAAKSSLWSPKRPRELQLIRDVHTGECQLLSARDTQVARNLYEGQALATRLLTQDGHEKWNIVAYSERDVLARASSLCTKANWEDHIPQEFGKGQQIIQTSSRYPQLTLEVEPLITSGPSDNRVDLVFFSDGCE